MLGDKYPDTVISTGNLSSTYSQQGHRNEIGKLPLLAMGNLAWTYSKRGQWKEVKKLGVQAVQMMKRELSDAT